MALSFINKDLHVMDYLCAAISNQLMIFQIVGNGRMYWTKYEILLVRLAVLDGGDC